ncbi:MAG: LCP family protein, partial [Ruminococcus sp.]|nr:LCP family protein [Ruminococcus sp.]
RPQPNGGYYNNNSAQNGAPQQGRPPQQQMVYPQNRPQNYQRSQGNGAAPQNSPPQQRRAPQQQTAGKAAPSQKQSAPKRKKKRRNPVVKIFLRIFFSLFIIFLIIFGIYSCTAVSLINKLNYTESGSRNHAAGALSADHVTNILLIGTDGRDVSDRGRSDTMILLSVNKENDKIVLTSFMRDSYVNIPGHGQDKLNHSYSYGGPDLLMDTIEQNFRIRIDDYVMVNFNSFASIVDAVDGIEIEVSDAEAQEINTILMAEVNELMGDPVDSDLLSGGGKIKLNGKQALAYARIRYVGNADFERTERQREVITEVAGKLKSFSFSMIGDIADKAIPQVSTNMTTGELYWLSLRLPFLLGYDIEQVQIPAEGTYSSATTSSGGSALAFDSEENYRVLEEQIYGE